MDSIEGLRAMVARQMEVCRELEAQLSALGERDLHKENAALRAELARLTDECAADRAGLKQATEENAGLKNALYEQVYNEKLGIINRSAKKSDIYFKSAVGEGMNSLTVLENSLRGRINSMRAALEAARADTADPIFAQLKALDGQINEKLTLARAQANRDAGAFSESADAEYEKLRLEGITEDDIKAAAKKNNLESFIGLNVLNKIGILLILIGVIAASQFTYYRLPDAFKGIMMFCIGALMLTAGELLGRKKANVVSLGLSAGGVGVLYAALGVSYFFLEILGMYPALALCVLITAGAFVLATRHDSQTIAAFALLGGYLPIISINESVTLVYAAMLYFAVLNLLALMLSFRLRLHADAPAATPKKWKVSAFIGLILNIAGTAYIFYTAYEMRSHAPGIIPVTLFYILFAFVIYSLIPIVGAYRAGLSFDASDVIFVAINTFFSSLIMYAAFYSFGLRDFDGLLAIAFAVFYILAARITAAKFSGGKRISALFYLTGFAFVVLTIPLQFGVRWLSLGWLLEGVAVTVYGILTRDKSFRKFGTVIFGLCLCSFILFDLLWQVDSLFSYKYFAITAGSVIILAALVYAKSLAGKREALFKYLTILNLYLFQSYIINVELYDLLPRGDFDRTYLCGALSLLVAFALAYATARTRIISDTVVKLISLAAYALGIMGTLSLNAAMSPINTRFSDAPPMLFALGTAALALLSLVSVLALYDLLRCLVLERKIGIEWLPLAVSAYFVFTLTQNLVWQYDLDFSSMIISLLYAATAVGWIAFGFYRRYRFIRLFGLALAIMSVAKLFLADLYWLTEGLRIVSYFAFGAALVAISFIYQYFNKRLELKVKVIDDEEIPS